MNSIQQCIFNKIQRLMDNCQAEYNKNQTKTPRLIEWEKQIEFLDKQLNS